MKTVSVAVLALLLAASSLKAENRFGLGVILGEPTGISLKRWISDDRAMVGGLAWSFSENASLQLHADYLIHKYDAFLVKDTDTKSNLRIPIYFGIGARAKLEEGGNESNRNDEDSLIGIRFPLGITYLYANTPFDIFVEIVPILDLFPDTEFAFNFALGARYYFD